MCVTRILCLQADWRRRILVAPLQYIPCAHVHVCISVCIVASYACVVEVLSLLHVCIYKYQPQNDIFAPTGNNFNNMVHKTEFAQLSSQQSSTCETCQRHIHVCIMYHRWAWLFLNLAFCLVKISFGLIRKNNTPQRFSAI